MERRVAAGFDTVLVVSEQERDRLPVAPATSWSCPNGRDPDPGILRPAPTPTAAFVATMGWAPNVDAAAVVRARGVAGGAGALPRGHGSCSWAGTPPPPCRRLQPRRSRFPVPFPTSVPISPRARVAVAPAAPGGGTRLKILEALDAGRPVVATSIAVDGLEDLIGEGVVVADDASSTVEAVAGLLADPDRAEALGRLGHEAVAARHSWDAALAPLLGTVVP